MSTKPENIQDTWTFEADTLLGDMRDAQIVDARVVKLYSDRPALTVEVFATGAPS